MNVRAICFISLIVILIAGCGKGSEPTAESTPEPAPGTDITEEASPKTDEESQSKGALERALPQSEDKSDDVLKPDSYETVILERINSHRLPSWLPPVTSFTVTEETIGSNNNSFTVETAVTTDEALYLQDYNYSQNIAREHNLGAAARAALKSRSFYHEVLPAKSNIKVTANGIIDGRQAKSNPSSYAPQVWQVYWDVMAPEPISSDMKKIIASATAGPLTDKDIIIGSNAEAALAQQILDIDAFVRSQFEKIVPTLLDLQEKNGAVYGFDPALDLELKLSNLEKFTNRDPYNKKLPFGVRGQLEIPQQIVKLPFELEIRQGTIRQDFKDPRVMEFLSQLKVKVSGQSTFNNATFNYHFDPQAFAYVRLNEQGESIIVFPLSDKDQAKLAKTQSAPPEQEVTVEQRRTGGVSSITVRGPGGQERRVDLRNRLFAPDGKRLVYMQDGDIYRATFDYYAMEPTDAKKMTDLGIFYPDTTLLLGIVGPDLYLKRKKAETNPIVKIDLNSGELAELNDPETFAAFSPGLHFRYGITTPDLNYTSVVNNVSGERFYLPIGNISAIHWLAPTVLRYGLKVYDLQSGQGYNISERLKSQWNEVADQMNSELPQSAYRFIVGKRFAGTPYLPLHFAKVDAKVGELEDIISSYAGQMDIRHHGKFPDDVEKSSLLLDLTDGSVASVAHGLPRGYEFVDSKHVIYRNSDGGLSEVGLWLLNLNTQEKTRLTGRPNAKYSISDNKLYLKDGEEHPIEGQPDISVPAPEKLWHPNLFTSHVSSAVPEDIWEKASLTPVPESPVRGSDIRLTEDVIADKLSQSWLAVETKIQGEPDWIQDAAQRLWQYFSNGMVPYRPADATLLALENYKKAGNIKGRIQDAIDHTQLVGLVDDERLYNSVYGMANTLHSVTPERADCIANAYVVLTREHIKKRGTAVVLLHPKGRQIYLDKAFSQCSGENFSSANTAAATPTPSQQTPPVASDKDPTKEKVKDLAEKIKKGFLNGSF